MSLVRFAALCVAGLYLTHGVASAAEAVKPAPHPPIAIHFSIPQSGYVTLVIEKPDGTRVRNLVSEEAFPAGSNTAWWDGLDDLARDTDAAAHGQYHIPGRLVAPGTYRVRGLVRPAIKVQYEFNPYDDGRPPWKTEDRSSEWLANHSAPSAVLFVPSGAAPERPATPNASTGQILVGSYVSEGGSGLAWLDPSGRKVWGQMWLGGVWTGAAQLARDIGPHPVAGVYAYAASSWSGDQHNGKVGELRLNALLSKDGQHAAPADARLGTGEDVSVLQPAYQIQLPATPTRPDVDPSYPERSEAVAGLAAYNGLVVVALRGAAQLLFIDAVHHRVLQTTPLVDPRGLAFDGRGRLLALSGKQLVRFDVNYGDALEVSSPQRVVATGLEDPQAVTLDSSGKIYVSDLGRSHQVKVFSPDGAHVRVIGHPGAPATGVYDPGHMNHPAGITIDSASRLWVAENDKTPKRVSVWDAATGRFVQAFYGPPRYGGSGALDPRDRTRFFYADEAGAMGFKLDWQAGSGVPDAIYYRAEDDATGLVGTGTGGMPEYPLYRDGELYLTNAHSAEVTGRPSVVLWHIGKDKVARPAAAAGSTLDSAAKLLPAFNSAAMRARMPKGIDPQADPLIFVWRDVNGDGRVAPEEVSFLTPKGGTKGNKPFVGNVTVLDDLSLAIAYAGDVAMVIPAVGLTPRSVPIYDIAHAKVLAGNMQPPVSSGGGQVLLGRGGWAVFTTPPAPFAPQSLGGTRNGVPMWSYPSVWPGLHASHAAAVPERPGELVGTTRVLGNPIDAPSPSDAGQLWAINGNEGNVYLFTIDGLFVATLFKDARLATAAPPRQAVRGMDLSATSLQYECFHPMLTRTADGAVFLQAGSTSPLLRIVGLAGVRRLPDLPLTVSASELVAAQRQATNAYQPGTQAALLDVEYRATPTAPGADAAMWPNADTQWAKIDTRNVQSGDWRHTSIETRAALAVFGGRLLIAIKTDDADLLNNSGESLQNLFTTGGGIDLMLGTDPGASAERTVAVAGDERLVVSRAHGQIVAMLYRPVASPRGPTPVTFSSALRTIRFDRMDDVSEKGAVSVTRDRTAGTGAPQEVLYKIDVPLKVLNLSVTPGTVISGDVGVLRGNGFQTLQRAYWANKASGLLSDLPGEAELTPNLWGRFRFVAATK
ncbi:hypothetical protein [Paraburkholderia lacunae]|uniref:Uncharacterized protein n=1 Tax=Paraburkholderia lacunae TaxID=2211104 RepID=A0A370MWW5_9BURK|nr:hypothetical protein [Paraburkholderia lacunae]RDJ97822.1 hypothetical protein DLM46_36110 [Paraburkholderia lacunae]